MQHVSTLLPWTHRNISIRPFKGYYSFNPSIHFDGEKWRCVMRNCDYNAKDGLYQVKLGRIITRNVLVEFVPETWEVLSCVEMKETDKNHRHHTHEWGYEDMRLFSTKSDGLVGIATTAQLRVESQQEIVICRFDDEWNIARADPVRGEWSIYAQKNWMPFDGDDHIRLLYSIDRGHVYDGVTNEILVGETEDTVDRKAYEHRPPSPRGGTETVSYSTRRSIVVPSNRHRHDWTPRGFRGGSQLVRVGDMWLGIGHDMKLINGLKYYWHRFILCTGDGKKIGESPDFKLASCGIEFAAGLAIDGKTAVISYGTEDMDSWLGFTTTEAIMNSIKPIMSRT